MHEAYVIPGVVDGAVVKAQAERRRDKEGKPTRIHFHRHGEACNNKCYIVIGE